MKELFPNQILNFYSNATINKSVENLAIILQGMHTITKFYDFFTNDTLFKSINIIQ